MAIIKIANILVYTIVIQSKFVFPLKKLYFLHNYLQPINARKESVSMLYILGENMMANDIVKQNGQNMVYQLLNLSSKVFVSILYTYVKTF